MILVALPRRSSGIHYALKCLDKREVVRMNQVEHTIGERHLLMHANHPFIVSAYAAFQVCHFLFSPEKDARACV